jgi:fibronectin-binding autotransporter adhesin
MRKILLAVAIFSIFSDCVSAAPFYWDADATATGNNATTGGNLGGSGDWDNLATANWWDGVSGSDSQWDDSAGSGAIFWGPDGSVTLSTPRTATSLAFKSNYVVTGSTLNLGAPAMISVDPSISTDIGSVLAGTNGYSVSGGGTLVLNGIAANTVTGPLSVSGGSTLAVTASDRIGGATGDVTLDDGTLRNADPTNSANPFLATTRSLAVGPGGGTIEVPGAAAILQYSGTITGAGNTLTMRGPGEIRMSSTTDFTFARLVVTGGGQYTLGQSQANGRDGQLGATPANFMQDQITLDGGTLRFNHLPQPLVLHANRGITLTTNGGTLRPTTSGTVPGKISGMGDLNIGILGQVSANTIQLNNTGNDWAGMTKVNAGTLRLGDSEVLPDSTNVVMANVSSAVLDLNGKTETIASLTGGGASGGTVAMGNGTLIVNQANNATYSSRLTQAAGTSGTFIKNGAGVLTFERTWDNAAVIINEGAIRFPNNAPGFADTALLTINANGTLDMSGNGTPSGAANDTIGDLAGSGKITGFISNINAGSFTNGLRITGARTTEFSGVIEGDGFAQLRVLKTGGSLTLSGNNNTWQGGTTVANGTLLVNNTSGSGTGTGAVTISGSSTAGGTIGGSASTVGGTGIISGQVNLNAGGHLAAGIGGANETLETTKVVAAAGGHIEGLLGAPGNSDVLRISDGTTPLTAPAGTILTAAATTLAVNGVYTLIDTDVDVSGTLGNFTFNNATGYDATLQMSGDNTNIEVNVTGTTLQDKTWTSDAAGNWSAAVADQGRWTTPGQPNGPGTTARFLSAITAARIITISDTHKIAGHLVFDNSFAYTIQSAGPNRLIMDSYSGNASITVNSGSHTILAPMTISAPTDINIVNAGSTLTLLPNVVTSGTFVNDAGVTKTGAGTLVIRTEWTGSGAVNINSGTIKNDTASNGGFSSTSLVTINGATSAYDMNSVNDTLGDLAGNGLVTNNSGGTGLTLVGGGTTTFSGTINGTSRLIVNKSAGSISLTGGNLYSGGTTVSAGKLLANNVSGSATGVGAVIVNGTGTLGGAGSIGGLITVSAGGAVAPGNSIGTLTANGGLLLGTGSVLNFELDTVSGSDVSDQVNVTAAGGLTINGGTLNLTNAGAMTAGTYTLFNYEASFGGALSNLTLGTQPAGFSYLLVNNMTATSIDLMVTDGAANPGDFNLDGKVDAADYVLWRKNPDSHGGPGGYTTWRTNFGNPPGSGSSIDGSAVPEPAALSLLLIIASALATLRRAR